MKEDVTIKNLTFESEDNGEAWLWQHLEGKQPLHPERLALPSEEELDAAEAEFDRIIAGRNRPRRLSLRPWAVSVAAAAAIAAVVFLLPKEELPKEELSQPEKTEAVALHEDSPHVEEKHGTLCLSTQHAASANTARGVGQHSTRRRPTRHAASGSTPQAEEQQAEQVVITPHEEALADIYLAEEALQVVLEQQAQQEAIRACVVSLTDEEPSHPIIAI